MKQRHTQPMAPEAKVEKTTDPGITPRPPTADQDHERPSQTRRRRAADTEPMAPPGLDDDLDDLANAALATPAIPERPDSDGARVARYAAEGKPMKAVAVTVPTGEVLVEPTNEPSSTPEATPDGPMVSRRDVVTGPSSRAVEAARAEAERRRTRNALLLAALVVGAIVAVVLLIGYGTRDPKVPEANPVSPPVPSATTPSAPTTPVDTQPRVLTPPPPPADLTIAVPAPVKPTHDPKGPTPSAGIFESTAKPTAAPPPTTDPHPRPSAAPVPTDITHNIY